MYRLTFYILLLLVSISQLAAQTNPYIWYQEERFILADRNEDALLSRDEMADIKGEFSFFLLPNHFAAADQNNDGKLSFRDILNLQQAETAWRSVQEQRALTDIETRFPGWEKDGVAFLLDNPAISEQLMQNLTWLSSHPEELQILLEKREWLRAHPQVINALEGNLRWLAADPSLAKVIYQKRPQPARPKLMGWRSDHMRFLQKNPSLESQYLNGFLPARDQR